MKMMKKLKKLAPPGINLLAEAQAYVFGLIASLLLSFSFFVKYADACRKMYDFNAVTGERYIRDGFIMPDFAELICGSFEGFILVAVCALCFIVYHYAYFSQNGSRALYTMRRLPERSELPKMCITLPTLAAAAALLIALVILLLYFGLYMLLTPEQCLRGGQWARIWSF